MGLGAPPVLTASPTDEQLRNIDCLTCHQKDYKRVKVDGVFAPDTANMTISLNQAVQTVHRPDRTACLSCHAKAGGGDAVKRGDLALASATTNDTQYDVHMSTAGADLSCLDCHTSQNHRIAGKGSDLRETDLDVAMACTSCHPGKDSSTGHNTADVNRHVARVACQTCHIPAIARDPAYPTHTVRDWTTATPPLLPTGLYGPYNQRQNNVIPVYKWWNRMLDAPPGPLGDINDANAKIMPWKEWLVTAPRDAASKVPIPIKAGTFSITGNITAAVNKGVQDSAFPYSGQWEPFSETVYFSNNHQVAPPEQALLGPVVLESYGSRHGNRVGARLSGCGAPACRRPPRSAATAARPTAPAASGSSRCSRGRSARRSRRSRSGTRRAAA